MLIPIFTACGSIYLCFFGYQEFLRNPASLVPRLPLLFILLLVSVRGVMQWFRIRKHNHLAAEELNRELAGPAQTTCPVTPSREKGSRWWGVPGRPLENFSLAWWGIGIIRASLTLLFVHSGLGWLSQNSPSWFTHLEEDSLEEVATVAILRLVIPLLSFASASAVAKTIQTWLGFTGRRD